MTTLITFTNEHGEQTLQVPPDRTLAGVITELFRNHLDDRRFTLWSVTLIDENGNATYL